MFPNKPSCRHPPVPFVSPGWERARPWGLRAFSLPEGCCLGKEKCWRSGNVSQPSLWLFPSFCHSAASCSPCLMPPPHPSSCPTSLQSPWSLLLCLCFTLGAALSPRLLAHIRPIQDPAQCILFHNTFSNPATIQQFIRSPHHSLHSLPETCSRPDTMPSTGVQRPARCRLCL